MKRIITLILFTLISTLTIFAQEDYELEEMFLDADSWFFYEDYQEALPLFLRVLDGDSLNYNVMYKIGYSDSKAFRTIFKKYTGLSPIDYKRKYNKSMAK